jgi:hypothetical protein
MHENILAALALDESIALAGVKPLHCSLFFHKNLILNLSYLMLLSPQALRQKRLQVLPCSPSLLTNPKVIQEQQTQIYDTTKPRNRQ